MLYRQPKRKPLSDALSLEKIVNQSGELENIIQKSNQLQQLSDIVNDCLPDLFKGKLLINGVNQQVLILTSPSAALSTKLRMHQPAILAKLQQQLPQLRINKIKIKIRPRKFRAEAAKIKREISKENALLLKEEAGQTNDKDLRDVLIKLAQHAS